MSETAGNTRPAAAADRSAGELIKEVTTLVPRLVRDEIAGIADDGLESLDD